MNLGQYHHNLKGADFPLWKAICKVWPKVAQGLQGMAVESGFEGERPLKDHSLQEIPLLNQEWMFRDAVNAQDQWNWSLFSHFFPAHMLMNVLETPS